MKKLFFCFMVALFIISFSFSDDSSAAYNKWEDMVNESAMILEDVRRVPEESIPIDLVKKAKAVAIFPSTISGGFIVGAKYGQGVILRRDGNNWSAPAVFNIAGGSFGLQIGGQATDIVLLIMTDRGLDGLLKSKFKLGGDAAVSAGPVGRDVEASTDLQLKGGILAYSRSRGLFAGVKLEGAVISPNREGNLGLYEKDLSVREILMENKARPTKAGERLINALKGYR